jgi:hypothetical protein
MGGLGFASPCPCVIPPYLEEWEGRCNIGCITTAPGLADSLLLLFLLFLFAVGADNLLGFGVWVVFFTFGNTGLFTFFLLSWVADAVHEYRAWTLRDLGSEYYYERLTLLATRSVDTWLLVLRDVWSALIPQSLYSSQVTQSCLRIVLCLRACLLSPGTVTG